MIGEGEWIAWGRWEADVLGSNEGRGGEGRWLFEEIAYFLFKKNEKFLITKLLPNHWYYIL